MTLNDLLQDLLARLDHAWASGFFLDADDIEEWPEGWLDILIGSGLLQPAEPATSMVCSGCEEACPMPVQVLPTGERRPARAFIVCDRRDDVGRVPVPLTRLEQWRSGPDLLATVVARLLGTGETPIARDGAWHLGRAEVNGGLRSFVLRPSATRKMHAAAVRSVPVTPGSRPVTLVPTTVGIDGAETDGVFTLSELLWFSGNCLTLDQSSIARGLDLHAPTVAPYRFRRDGDFWDICYQGTACKVKDSKGLIYIATLLDQPGQEAHVFELNQAANGVQSDMTDPMLSSMSGEALESIGLSVGDLGDAGEVMTPEGKQRLRLSIQQFDDQIADAEEVGLSDEADRLKEQKTLIFEHLASSMGLGGRTRKSASAVEKVRKAVTQAIQRSIRSFEKTHPPLKTHLANTITTGTACIYRPEKPIPWRLE